MQIRASFKIFFKTFLNVRKDVFFFRNLDQLKKEAEVITKELKEEKLHLEKNKAGQRERLERIDEEYRSLLSELEENETHVQLLNLERKWQHIEQNNFAMKVSRMIYIIINKNDIKLFVNLLTYTMELNFNILIKINSTIMNFSYSV